MAGDGRKPDLEQLAAADGTRGDDARAAHGADSARDDESDRLILSLDDMNNREIYRPYTVLFPAVGELSTLIIQKLLDYTLHPHLGAIILGGRSIDPTERNSLQKKKEGIVNWRKSMNLANQTATRPPHNREQVKIYTILDYIARELGTTEKDIVDDPHFRKLFEESPHEAIKYAVFPHPATGLPAPDIIVLGMDAYDNPTRTNKDRDKRFDDNRKLYENYGRALRGTSALVTVLGNPPGKLLQSILQVGGIPDGCGVAFDEGDSTSARSFVGQEKNTPFFGEVETAYKEYLAKPNDSDKKDEEERKQLLKEFEKQGGLPSIGFFDHDLFKSGDTSGELRALPLAAAIPVLMYGVHNDHQLVPALSMLVHKYGEECLQHIKGRLGKFKPDLGDNIHEKLAYIVGKIIRSTFTHEKMPSLDLALSAAQLIDSFAMTRSFSYSTYRLKHTYINLGNGKPVPATTNVFVHKIPPTGGTHMRPDEFALFDEEYKKPDGLGENAGAVFSFPLRMEVDTETGLSVFGRVKTFPYSSPGFNKTSVGYSYESDSELSDVVKKFAKIEKDGNREIFNKLCEDAKDKKLEVAVQRPIPSLPSETSSLEHLLLRLQNGRQSEVCFYDINTKEVKPLYSPQQHEDVEWAGTISMNGKRVPAWITKEELFKHGLRRYITHLTVHGFETKHALCTPSGGAAVDSLVSAGDYLVALYAPQNCNGRAEQKATLISADFSQQWLVDVPVHNATDLRFANGNIYCRTEKNRNGTISTVAVKKRGDGTPHLEQQQETTIEGLTCYDVLPDGAIIAGTRDGKIHHPYGGVAVTLRTDIKGATPLIKSLCAEKTPSGCRIGFFTKYGMPDSSWYAVMLDISSATHSVIKISDDLIPKKCLTTMNGLNEKPAGLCIGNGIVYGGRNASYAVGRRHVTDSLLFALGTGASGNNTTLGKHIAQLSGL